MNTITFSIDKEIFAKHLGFRRAILIIHGVSNKGGLEAEINEQIEAVRLLDVEDTRLTAWREAFVAEGMKVRDFRPSIDALVRRIQAGKPFGTINKIVDIGTVNSLKYVLPAGAHPILPDTQKVSLERAKGDEVDITLDGKSELVSRGEIVLKDNGRLASRRWVWRQTPLSRIDGRTTDFFLNIDALSVIDDKTLEEAVEFSRDLIRSALGVEATVVILGANNQSEVA